MAIYGTLKRNPDTCVFTGSFNSLKLGRLGVTLRPRFVDQATGEIQAEPVNNGKAAYDLALSANGATVERAGVALVKTDRNGKRYLSICFSEPTAFPETMWFNAFQNQDGDFEIVADSQDAAPKGEAA